MRGRWLAISGCLLAAFAVGFSACGDDDDDGGGGGGGGTASGTNVSWYSSLPLQGSGRKQNLDVNKGVRLALKQKNNKAGACTIKFTALDDSTASAGQWDPQPTSANARRAGQDKNAVAYIGEFNSGASAISIPLTNEAGLLQVSPANTALELTKDVGPDDKGAPEKYYPSGKRTYARVVPADHIQGSALADWMKEEDVKRLYIANDRQVYGVGVAKTTADAAKRRGIEVVANEGMDPKAANYRGLAAKIKESGADAFFFGGIVQNNGVQLYTDIGTANPDITLWGPDGVAEAAYTEEVRPEIGERTNLTIATIDPKDYPPEGQKFFEDFEKEYGEANPQPYAIYGYEAGSLILDAMERAGDECNDRQAVVDQVFQTKDKKSVLGTYDIDQDGDTTVNDFGRYRVENKELGFIKSVKVTEDSNGKKLGG